MNAQKKILIVDDEELNLDFFELMLSKLGFIVEKARDGIEALEKAKRFLPDLILLDNIMPRMSGWELTKKLKSDVRFSNIPIIMLSALDDIKDKIEGYELGIDDYITKPFNFSEVLARIRVVLRNRALFTQIAVRETRLTMAEELNSNIRNYLINFNKDMDDLEKIIEECEKNTAAAEKTREIKKQIAEIECLMDKTSSEWDELKKNEIKLPVLEKDFYKSFNADQE